LRDVVGILIAARRGRVMHGDNAVYRHGLRDAGRPCFDARAGANAAVRDAGDQVVLIDDARQAIAAEHVAAGELRMIAVAFLLFQFGPALTINW
jgi:hypothetical protein